VSGGGDCSHMTSNLERVKVVLFWSLSIGGTGKGGGKCCRVLILIDCEAETSRGT